MKKVILSLFALSAVLVSCNREGSSDPTNAESRIVNYSKSELSGDLIEMNQSFQIVGKEAATLSYSYKAYAEPPQVNSIRTNATSVTSIRDVVFVTWHTLAGPYGGAITAYKLNTSNGQYEFTDRIDFVDTDFHEAEASINTGLGTYEVFAVGQRDPDQSGYLLANHEGAVVTRIDYDYINDAFDASSFKELPLPSYAGNGIVAAAGSYYIVTGNGTGNTGVGSVAGGLYRTDYALTNVSEAMPLTDGIAITINEANSTATAAYMSILDRTGASSFDVEPNFFVDNGSNNGLSFRDLSGGYSFTVAGTDLERGGLDWASGSNSLWGSDPDSLMVAVGASGLYDGYGDPIADYGTCLATAYDPGARVVYYAGGDGGLYVLAGEGYPGGALINTHDLIGSFTPPTGGSFPGQYDIKDVSVYGSENIALATGLGGMYFIKRN